MATFTVKNESINDFIATHIPSYRRECGGMFIYPFTDSIKVAINKDFKIGDDIEIFAESTALDRKTILINKWSYEVERYDSMNLNLVLTDFEVSQKDIEI